ncbi:hypothetical protein A8L34_11865 [Bacillus sp. FJAT-27264]|uniref:hypothetical protein n=1 Tax=Paenibacillus sp. (strain DSM 101736 / FJAT-27264) TaxID=1850362 RepID=UPI000807B2AD|nr:hypothetical protein [Bacillus sp. FJAT-27264]OBZ14611.1 hypothetical protein A8L34_11865 [Bacillus sp. FJAT-27264]
MNLFQLKSREAELLKAFLEDHYVCIGYPGLGDLEGMDRDELDERLQQAYGYQGQALAGHAEVVNLFVHTMQDGDYLLVADGDWVHLGDLGDYFYDERFDIEGDGRCHRRGVTWLTSIPYAALNSVVKALLAEEAIVSMFQEPIAAARLDLWIRDTEASGNFPNKGVLVEEETVAEALDILKKALKSPDADRRERAAIAILQYAK